MILKVVQKILIKTRHEAYPRLKFSSACSCEQNKAKQKLIQKQRSDVAGGISIKTLKRGAAVKFQWRSIFFFRLGGNDGGEGAYTQYVTEADRVSNDV